MKKILISLSTILFVGVVAVGATGAFFSDTETSTGNTFTAGAIDLGIDNTSYYNGERNDGTTWSMTFDLDQSGNLFFNFDDLKPGDYGEDTISIHINNNEAWLCADITLISDNDNSCTEPEDDAEGGSCIQGSGNGDLAQYLDFLWWADDGDNVLEEGEQVLQPHGNLGQLGVGNTSTVDLADANNNIWGTSHEFILDDNSILTDESDEILFIGKAWCFGEITAEPDDQDNSGNSKTPAGDNAGTGTDLNDPDSSAGDPIDGGFLCNGSIAGNEAQTDSVVLTVAFRAEQARNNAGFECNVPQ